MKKSTAHLQYGWWKYLLIALLSITIWSVVFDVLSAPEKNEKIRITCVGDDFLCDALEEDLWKKLPEITEQRLEKIAVESPVNGQSTDFYSVMAARAYGADLIIVEESAITETFGQSFFMPLPVEELPEALSDRELYVEEGAVYGILLYDGTTPNVFSRFYGGDQRCFVFITHNCVNAAGVMGVGDAQDDAALRLIEYLLEEN